MMKINISQLRKDPGSAQPFSFKTSAGELSLDNPEVWVESMVVDGCIINKGMIYEVTGKIRATINQCCSRCLEDMVTILNVAFSEEYREAEFEKSGEALVQEINYFSGDEIDITDLIRENILLAEPIKPVCSESCRGLCPECGVNLNINTCGCNSIKTDPRLAVLEKLLSKD
ncbi:DUF177 domain-containing protein [Sporomusa sp.]|uniref:YceD family protein n=1 Tax=Sporomusa sp. TaxID=2078658 RepID=UPI002CA0691E|nr:DUF177 domain-containing protein [Sporomusa sp.]HWR43220.1 DUF177 domain-containing protein [Sporomusa sp.]